MEYQMINLGKYSILGINVNAVDYDFAVSKITSAAVLWRFTV